jgi:hypothetical protein
MGHAVGSTCLLSVLIWGGAVMSVESTVGSRNVGIAANHGRIGSHQCLFSYGFLHRVPYVDFLSRRLLYYT